MKALFKFSSLSVWVICVSLVACTDHQEPGTERLRIKKLTRSLPYQHGYSVVSILGYDWQGRLDSVYSYQTADSAHSPTQTSNFQYDNQGRLAQMKRTLSTGGSERYVYTYDGAGKISSIRYTGGDHDYYDLVPAYDGAGNLTETTRSFHFYSAISYLQQNQYTFSSGNLSRLIATTTIEKGVPATSVSTTDFVYDDHPNPFYGISLIPAPVGIAAPTSGNFSHYTYCGGVDNFLHLSRNNPTSSNIKGYTQTLYRYQYNALGLPESRATLVKPMLDLPAVLSETLLFEYETY
ncbi:hypothetical protein GCM10007423_23330 [Dyadobacter endophyticus]|uniref:YD repeat-containing protein n=1 Tax=Dyadobacter endophyticus TaxID=1749036 RepID=A0ABQ1YQY4_9BACT|nr:hypothetical protein [Dyadobacter endophyticus]GGH33224.1 hypothetical protein GCM10007423_23330 [Dyadobacter endophyticus]